MKALVYNGPGKIEIRDKPKPEIREPHDAIVKLLRTTICGSDLHIINGHVPIVEAGTTLGHEGVGIVEEIGADVKEFKKGDRVLISCITQCATCTFCKKGKHSFCNDGGWRLGGTHDGAQAEYVRIMHANASLLHVPDGVDERSLLVLSDILPTGLEVGVLNGGVTPASTVAIIGAGPIGLAALLTAQMYTPSVLAVIDKDEGRLEVAKRMGATHTFSPDKGDLKEQTKDLHGEMDGFDVVIEAVGFPETFQACQDLVGKGGAIANVGVHGSKVDLHLEQLWIRGIKITTGLVDTRTTPMLMKLFVSGKLNTKEMITHDYKFSEIEKAYDTFKNAGKTGALKLNIEMD